MEKIFRRKRNSKYAKARGLTRKLRLSELGSLRILIRKV